MSSVGDTAIILGVIAFIAWLANGADAGGRGRAVFVRFLLWLIAIGEIIIGAVAIGLAPLMDEMNSTATNAGASGTLSLDISAGEINLLGVVILAAGLTSALLLLPPVVRLWGRAWGASPGLVARLAVVLVAQVLWLQVVYTNASTLTSQVMTEMSFSITDVFWNSSPMFVLAVIGVGLWSRRSGRATLKRLGFIRPTWREIGIGLAAAVGVLVFSVVTDPLFRALDPAGYARTSASTTHILSGITTIPLALALGVISGGSEEALFRGALQPRFGLLFTSVFFALVHAQYGLTIATLQVLVVGLLLGFLRTRYNTTTSFVTHAAYNTLVAILTFA